MLYRDIVWLWNTSARIYPDKSLMSFKNRLVLIAMAIRMSASLQPLIHAAEGSLINKLITQRPETIGAVVWPYQCLTWDAETRLNHIREHYAVIEALTPKIDFPVDGALKLLDLNDIYEGFHVVLDQPKWFIREGQLVINLFLKNVRILSLAFSFAYESDKAVAYVGALQGRNLNWSLDIYREITKATYGIRPRDFLFELFRTFCCAVGISKIYAVSDSSRHHRSSYFNKKNCKELTVNYDEIWKERGGILENSDFYVFSMNRQEKNLEDIASKKRSMYRQKYELLKTIDARMLDVCAHLDDKRLLEYPFNSL